MEYILSLSGGKDSIAAGYVLLESGCDLAAAVHFDGGWEFPEVTNEVLRFEENTGVRVVRLTADFDHFLLRHPVKSSIDRPEEGVKKGEIRYFGYGWPDMRRRWCTELKTNVINHWVRYNAPEATQCIGFAVNEQHRTQSKAQLRGAFCYPLIEAGMSEKDALAMCYEHGHTWGGLYESFSRLSCFCCPMQGKKGFRKLRNLRPELWKRILDMDAQRPAHNAWFCDKKSAEELEQVFKKADQQMELEV